MYVTFTNNLNVSQVKRNRYPPMNTVTKNFIFSKLNYPLCSFQYSTIFILFKYNQMYIELEDTLMLKRLSSSGINFVVKQSERKKPNKKYNFDP